MSKRNMTDAEIKKKRKQTMIETCIIVHIAILYFCMLLGHGFYVNKGQNGFTIIMDVIDRFPSNFYQILPTKISWVLIGIVIGALVDALVFESYQRKKDIVNKPHGDAAFEDDFVSFNKEFVIDPGIVEKVTGEKPKTIYDEEHKKLVISPRVKNNLKDKIYKECWLQTQLYADGVALSLNGFWSQRNTNAIIFGASGSGKSRFFLNPNLLQANSNYVITDPSGEIMLGYGAFLQKDKNYIVKCLNISDMEHSCRFNPLQYIRDSSDIPVIVTTLMENTQKQKSSGGDDFWTKTTQALLCAIIGYLYEVEPIEHRNFYNVLEMLRMASEDEDAQDQEDTDFDKMFAKLGEKNPNSYAFHQYQTYSLAPRKTALNILISTAVLLSTYVDIPEFNNLTYKDEMELDKFGAAPYKLQEGATLNPEDEDRYEERYKSGKLQRGYIDVEDFKKYKDLIERDKNGRYKEGDPYKMAIFLCIPTADTTYNWITAMVYSLLFKMVYRRGETRAKEQVVSNPKLAYPARFLIDECANIGKIPNLQEYLATCRKYSISIVPIFQSFSQIEKVYGKEDANSIYANCDTTLFLGGIDSQTLKIVCERLGKDTVRGFTINQGKKGGGGGSSSEIAKEIMSRIQVEQMSNAKCLVFIRGLKPFWVKKFNLNGHPNYKYTAEADPDNHSFVNPFFCEYDDMSIEAIRIKKVGEIGYNEPKEINSARLRASKQQAQEARKDMAISLQRAAMQYGQYDENANYASEAERKSAKANHEAYIEALRTTFLEAKSCDDSYSMDVIRSTCYRYDIDIGIDIGLPRESVRERSSGRLNSEEREILRELTEEETVDLIKQSGMVGSSIVSGIKQEFDLATLEQVAANLGGMVKGINAEDTLNKIYSQTSVITQTEELASEESSTKEDMFEKANEDESDSIFTSNIQTEDILMIEDEDSDYLDENSVESIEDMMEKNIKIDSTIDTEDTLVNNSMKPDGNEELDVLSEEDIENALEVDIDFTGMEESEDHYDTYGEESLEELKLDNDNIIDEEVETETTKDVNELGSGQEIEKSIKIGKEFDDSKTKEVKDSPNENSEVQDKEDKVAEVKGSEETPKSIQDRDVNTKKKPKFMVYLDDEDDDEFTF